MKWRCKLTTKVIVTATAGVVVTVLGCAIIVIAQGLPNDWGRHIAFSAPPSIAPEESNRLRYRILQNGIPEDWSHHHLVFSPPSTPEHRQLVEREPRYWMQQLRRQWQLSMNTATVQLDSNKLRRRKRRLHRDWSVNMGSGAKVGAGIFPAKFSFGTTGTPSCSTDFVVYNTGLAGSSSQASIIAFNNLYNTT